MAKCAICEKAAHFGIKVSHSHRRSNKMWKANVKSVNPENVRMYFLLTFRPCRKSLIFEQSVKNPGSFGYRDFFALYI